MNKSNYNDDAFTLLRMIINNARNGKSYKDLIAPFHKALDKDPEVKKVFEEAVHREELNKLKGVLQQ